MKAAGVRAILLFALLLDEPALRWQLEFLSLHHFGKVDCETGRVSTRCTTSSGKLLTMEKVQVKPGLHQPREHADRINRVLRKVPIDPIGDVQSPVSPQRKEIMRGDRLCLPCSLKHEELREDRDGFEVDAEGPEDLFDC